MMELGVPSYLINAVMLGVLAQRLVRTLCPQCKQPDDTVTRESLEAIVKPWQITGSVRAYKPVGCVDCRMTGYMGRMGLYELLSVSEAFKEQVTKEPNLGGLRRQAVIDGMRPAAPGRRAARGRGRDHHRGSAERHAAPGSRVAPGSPVRAEAFRVNPSPAVRWNPHRLTGA
jgi:type II secretory ATPase GspE/PulE/Tfp pilus assembly ATPase PilB-like protein